MQGKGGEAAAACIHSTALLRVILHTPRLCGSSGGKSPQCRTLVVARLAVREAGSCRLLFGILRRGFV